MTKAEQIIELAGGQYVGIQKTDGVPLVLFRDPVSGTCLALRETILAVDAVISKMQEAREVFDLAIAISGRAQ